jgi:hypothetical protein
MDANQPDIEKKYQRNERSERDSNVRKRKLLPPAAEVSLSRWRVSVVSRR